MDFTVFPNPSNDLINLEAGINSDYPCTLQIVNTLGQVLYNETMEKGHRILQKQLNISNFKNGVYCVTLLNGSHTKSKLFIKQ